jgi:hypothetical protein
MPTPPSKAAYCNDQRQRSEVERLSRDCPFCEGNGMVTVYHPRFAADSVGNSQDGRRYATAIAAHCRCDAGNWIRERVPPELQARIPRVEDICLGRSRWLLIPPGPEHDLSFPDRPPTREDFSRLVKRPPRAQKQTAAQIEAALQQRSKKLEAVTTASG